MMATTITTTRTAPGPSITPETSLQADCRAWAGLRDMITRLEAQAAEIADRVIAAVGDDTQKVPFVDGNGDERTCTVVRVPIRTFDRDALQQALPKRVYESILADPSIDRERLAAAVKLGQVDPKIAADATTTTWRRSFLRIGAVKK